MNTAWKDGHHYQCKKIGLREAKDSAPGHRAEKWWRLNANPELTDSTTACSLTQTRCLLSKSGKLPMLLNEREVLEYSPSLGRRPN